MCGVEKQKKKKIDHQSTANSDTKDDVIVVVNTRFSDMEESDRYRVNGYTINYYYAHMAVRHIYMYI